MWLDEDAASRRRGDRAVGTPYESVTVPAPRAARAAASASSWLRATTIRSRRRHRDARQPDRSLVGTPRRPSPAPKSGSSGSTTTLQAPSWVDAPTQSHSGANGDFAALLRLLRQSRSPRSRRRRGVGARLRVRRAAHDAHVSTQFSLPAGPRHGTRSSRLPGTNWCPESANQETDAMSKTTPTQARTSAPLGPSAPDAVQPRTILR